MAETAEKEQDEVEVQSDPDSEEEAEDSADGSSTSESSGHVWTSEAATEDTASEEEERPRAIKARHHCLSCLCLLVTCPPDGPKRHVLRHVQEMSYVSSRHVRDMPVFEPPQMKTYVTYVKTCL